MKITHHDLQAAVTRGIINPEQLPLLWAHLCQGARDTPQFSFNHVLYYLGGLIAISAMSLFMTLGWERFGGWGIFSIAIGYSVLGIWLTEFFLRRKGLKIPAGIMAALVVVLTPLAIYGLQLGLGAWAGGIAYRAYHTHIDWRWLLMEFGTLAMAAIILWRYRMPFSVMPVAVTLWYMSMDLVPFLFGVAQGLEDWALHWELRQLVSLWFGLLMLLLAFWVDMRSRHDQDFAFWLYLFGMITFWGGLSLMHSDSEWSKFLYLCINLFCIATGALLSRRVFVVFGAFGTAGYVGHLAYEIFRDSLLFPFALSLLGIGIIFLGILWQRHEIRIANALHQRLPIAFRELIARAV